MRRIGKLDIQSKIKVIDYSDKDGFQFGFTCGICGFEWRSERIPFVLKGFGNNLDEKDIELLWKEERLRQFEMIKTDASIEFNKCPACGTWVCDECFFVDYGDKTDFCKECIEEIKNVS